MQTRVAVLITALALEGLVTAQGQAPPQPQSQSYSAGATAVLVDVVVRTKQGRPLLGLTSDDFEVFEDGVRQKIGSFSVVERAGGIGIRVGRRVAASPATEKHDGKLAGSTGHARRPIVRPSRSCSTRSSRTPSSWHRGPRSPICR